MPSLQFMEPLCFPIKCPKCQDTWQGCKFKVHCNSVIHEFNLEGLLGEVYGSVAIRNKRFLKRQLLKIPDFQTMPRVEKDKPWAWSFLFISFPFSHSPIPANAFPTLSLAGATSTHKASPSSLAPTDNNWSNCVLCIVRIPFALKWGRHCLQTHSAHTISTRSSPLTVISWSQFWHQVLHKSASYGKNRNHSRYFKQKGI